jgi:hypothetical protein
MDHPTMLTRMLKLHFGWHLARVKCLSCLMIALFKVKTVNFTELATAFSGSAKVDSHYRRIQRFFKEVSFATMMRVELSVVGITISQVHGWQVHHELICQALELDALIYEGSTTQKNNLTMGNGP